MEEIKNKIETVTEFPGANKSSDAPTLLAVFAHPDDETFTAGGTLAQHAENGWRVKLVCVTHGEGGAFGREHRDPSAYKALRVAELREAARYLGVEELIIWDWGDGKVSARDFGPSQEELLRILERTQPDVVLTFGPDGISGHPDHVAVSQLTTAAFSQYRKSHAQPARVQLYYVAASASVPSCCRKGGDGAPPLPVTTKVDIRCAWPAKLAAMRAYKSQRHLLEALQEGEDAVWMEEESFHRTL